MSVEIPHPNSVPINSLIQGLLIRKVGRDFVYEFGEFDCMSDSECSIAAALRFSCFVYRDYAAGTGLSFARPN